MRGNADDNLPEMLGALQILKRLDGLLESKDAIDVGMNLVELCKSQQLLELLFRAYKYTPDSNVVSLRNVTQSKSTYRRMACLKMESSGMLGAVFGVPPRTPTLDMMPPGATEPKHFSTSLIPTVSRI